MKYFIITILTACIALCWNYKSDTEANSFVDTAMVPANIVSADDKGLRIDNGIFYYKTEPFSGQILERYPDGSVNNIASFLNGRQYGWSRSYYNGGQLREERCYKENKCYGRHTGWWEDGTKKFEFSYTDDKKEGKFRQWYKNGVPYTFLNFKNDLENGMQQAWRENGKLFINYEVKDGYAYGLKKSVLCYTLIEENLAKR